MQGIFGRFSKFINNLEESIDAKFVEDEQNLTQNDEKAIKKEVPDYHIEEEEKKEEEEAEEDKEIDAEALHQKCEEIQNEIENFNQEFLKLQEVVNNIGPDGPGAIAEYKERKAKHQNSINLLQNSEKELKNKLKDFDKIKNKFENLQITQNSSNEQLKTLNDHLNSLKSQEKSLNTKIEDTHKLIEKSDIEKTDIEEQIEKNQKEHDSFLSQIKPKKDQTAQLEKSVKLLEQNFVSIKSELNKANSEKDDFDKNVDQLKNEIQKIKADIEAAKQKSKAKGEERRKARANGMRQFTSDKVQKLEEERHSLLIERDSIKDSIQAMKDSFAKDLRTIEAKISAAEVTAKELELRRADVTDSLPRLRQPLEERLASLKAVYEANKDAGDDSVQRLRKEKADTEAQIGRVRAEAEVATKDVQEANGSLKSLKETAQELILASGNLSKEKESEIEISEKNKKLREKLTSDLSEAKEGNEALKAKLAAINTQIEQAEKLSEARTSEMKRQLKFHNERIESFSRASPLDVWRGLTDKVAKLERERDEKNAVITEAQLSGLSYKFENALIDVSNIQEEIDQLKKVTDRDKAFFKQELIRLMELE